MVWKKILLFAISILGLSLFAGMTYLVITKSHWLEIRDMASVLKLSTHRSGLYDFIFVLLSYLGESLTLIVLSAFFVILPSRKKLGIPLAIISAISFAFCYVAKTIVARDRPSTWLLQNPILGYSFPDGYSFPSGHAQTAVVFWLSLAILYAINICKNKVIGDLIVANSTILCFMLCFARVYLGVHYISDVLGGIGLAIYLIGTGVLLFSLFENRHKTFR